MRLWSLLGAGLLLAASGPAQAQASGTWRVNGAIAGRSFVLDCRFEGAGGVCVDVEGKRAHPLTSLSAQGERIAWSFATKVMFASITLNFDGAISGNRMSGTMRAAGRSGTFTGTRR